ncbi:MAG: hypothetical protein FWD70_02640 [Desulfuromonadales bacterium]|nr:hypothetical protein [Desulfuromonadales bacterium]
MTRKIKITVWFISVFLFMVALFAFYIWVVLNWSYAKGERTGYIQKFSKRGWICKTWEGEMSIVTVPGSLPEKFDFSLRDDALATKINNSLGKRVSITYEEHVGVPTACFGDTEFYVTGINIVE